ncbi:NifU family protein [Actinomadura latina]|uniref:NifU family protein n=1 Tax=Actinomadura latina TaxID=163603 RepID=A0A846Z0A2_9ACTN|nr:NifU family protein [Actinomadura latina]NKZ03806.1 NifU family protein [Actinomadura latina]
MGEPAPDPLPDGGRDGPRRLGPAAVADRLGGLDAALGTLERTPGATAETAMAAVSMLTEVYGEALARVMDRVSGQRRLVEDLMDDELLGHLLILHGIHPETAEQRVVRALDALRRQGAGAEFAGMDGATVRVRQAGGCGCGAGRAKETVREAVLAAAPEIAEVEFVEPPAKPAAFVPVDALMRPPVPAGDGTP